MTPRSNPHPAWRLRNYSARGASPVPHKAPLALECNLKTRHPLFDFVSGTAHGSVLKVSQNVFVVVPTYIEDYCGPYRRWNEPEYGQPIYTEKPLRTRAAAQRAFQKWAQLAFETKWQFPKSRAAKDEPAKPLPLERLT